MDHVRNSVKAIIIRDNKLLCIRLRDKLGYFYILPGGGQDKFETFIQALQREGLEELGARIKVGKLRYIREYISRHHEFREEDDNHQVEFMFDCELDSEPDIKGATQLDNRQDGFEWIDLSDTEHRVFPKVLLERLRDGNTDIYWGDVN
jgi:8-oxo-dGTP diphosphatase